MRPVCAFTTGFERVFHPLHHGIELLPFGCRIGNSQDIHDARSAGEHYLFIISDLRDIHLGQTRSGHEVDR